MPSSTSNSDISWQTSRIPQGTDLWIIVWAIGLLVLLFAGAETFWRVNDHIPCVNDTKAFWSLHRRQVYRSGGKKRIVIVGASRAQMGLVPAALEEELPEYEAVHLGAGGAQAFALVQDLAQDPEFDGIILWSLIGDLMLPGSGQGVQSNIEFFHANHRNIGLFVNTQIAVELQSRAVALAPNLSLPKLLSERWPPRKLFYAMQRDRFLPGWYQDRMTDEERKAFHDAGMVALRLKRKRRPSLDFDAFEQFAKGELSEAQRTLSEKGGQLVLIRMPTTGGRWELDQSYARKDLVWDRIEALSGVPAIHFLDHPELSGFDCPDASHLDATDAPEFTRRLARILRDRLPAM